MKRTRLLFDSIQQIVGGDGFSAIVMTDESHQRALTIICDKAMTEQFMLRLRNIPERSMFLPEALLAATSHSLEMVIYDVSDGQYRTLLINKTEFTTTPIRISDACLLTVISSIPVYIDEQLMSRQSTPYDSQATGVAIPINTIQTTQLHETMKKAINEENYELAAQIRDELARRTNRESES